METGTNRRGQAWARPIPRGAALHAQALRIARRLEEVEAALGHTLGEILESRAFATFWFRDLEEYAAKALGIDPARTRQLLGHRAAGRIPGSARAPSGGP